MIGDICCLPEAGVAELDATEEVVVVISGGGMSLFIRELLVNF